MAHINGQAAGYMITTGGTRKPLVLRHNTVEEELWSRGIGTALVESLLEWTALWSPHPIIEVRTRRLILPQEVINARVGGLVCSSGLMIGVRGQPVDTWRVPLTCSSRVEQDVPPDGLRATIGSGLGRRPRRILRVAETPCEASGVTPDTCV